MLSKRTRNQFRKLTLALALAGLTVAIGIYGGNLRNGIGTFSGWPSVQKAVFIVSLLLVVFAGGPPLRAYLSGEWRPFFDAPLPTDEDRDL